MFRSNSGNLVRMLAVLFVFILGFGGVFSATQPSMAQTFRLADCTLLYAVQSGDTLSQIAGRFGTTSQDIQDLNPYVTNPNRIFPGLVLCITTEAEVVIPVTGLPTERAGIYVVDVDPGASVTVQGAGFSLNVPFVVQMIPFGASTPRVHQVGFYTPTAEVFTTTFDIPEDLEDAEHIRIRLFSSTAGEVANNVFINDDVSRVTPGDCLVFHTVDSLENLSGIAREYDTTTNQLVEDNNIVNRSLVYPGQMLCVETRE